MRDKKINITVRKENNDWGCNGHTGTFDTGKETFYVMSFNHQEVRLCKECRDVLKANL